MKTRNVLLLALLLINEPSQAATEFMIWGVNDRKLAKYDADIKDKDLKQIPLFSSSPSKLYQLKRLNDNEVSRDLRYQMYYKNIPIWGHELILHKGAGGKKFFTGIDVSGIEVDVPQLQNGLNKETLENKILSEISGNILFKNTEKVIYLDKNKKAHLAYHLAMYVNQENAVVAPNYIIDANSGQVLKFWDDVTHNKIGQGYGGNVFVLPYRTGLFQHGDSKRDLPILGKFDVQVKGDTCFVESPEIRVINVAKTDLSRASFPMLSMVEFLKNHRLSLIIAAKKLIM